MNDQDPVRLVGSIEVDLSAYRIRRPGAAFHVRQQTAQVLGYLMAHRDRVVPKDELIAAVWKETAVSDSALAQCIKEIRQAFGDTSKDSRFIRTVPKVGYQFIGFQNAGLPADPPAAPESASDPHPPRWSPRGVLLATTAALGVAAAAVLAAYLGIFLARARPSRGATELLTTSLEAYSKYSQAVQKADGYHLPEALTLLRQARDIDPSFVMAEARIGYAYAVQGGWAAPQGLPYLQRAFQASDRLSEADRALILAWYAVARRDYPAAIDAYRRRLAIHPQDSEAYGRLGRLLQGEERYDEAIGVLTTGASMDPYNGLIHNALSSLYIDVARYDAAVAAAARYVALTPAEPNAHDSLGLAYQAAGQFDLAIAAYDRAIALDSGFALAFVHRGNARFQQGQFRAALDDFQAFTLRADSTVERARGHLNRGWVFLAKGDLTGAQSEVDAAVRMSSDIERSPRVWAIRLAAGIPIPRETPPQVLDGRGQASFLRIHHAYRGEWALLRNQPDAALSEFKEAIRHRPIVWDIEPYDDGVARCYFHQQDWLNAVREYRAVIAARPMLGRPYFELAQAYDALGDRTAANTAYARFLKLWSDADADAPQIQHARRRLAIRF